MSGFAASKCLALTADTRFWDTTRPLVLLGEWCVPTARDAGIAYEAVLSSPWDVPRNLDALKTYLDGYHDTMLSFLGERLNALHGTDLEARLWRILAGNWLLHAIHVLYDKHLLLGAARPHAQGILAPLIDDTVLFGSVDLFKYAQESADLSLIVMGRLARAMGFAVTQTAISLDLLNSRFAPRWKNGGMIRRAGRFWRGKLRRLRNARATTLFYHTDLPQTIVGKLPPGTGAMVQERQPPAPGNVADIAARKALFSGAPAADEFQRLAAEIMPYLIPKSLVEDFADWRGRAMRAPLPSSVRTLITSYGLTGDDLCSHQIVLALQNGATLCGMQHGGGYGSYRICPAEDHESRCSDHWLSWGAEDAPNYVPLPPLRCVGLSVRDRAPDPSGRLILVGSDRHPLTYRVMSDPMSGQMGLYFQWQERFFLALPDDARAQFKFRPYFLDFGNPGYHWWKERDAKVANAGVAELLSRDRLFIFDHNGTGFLETLCLDVPTLLYWNPAVWKLRDSAKPAFDIMKAAGMFHETPEAAAAEAGRALADLQGWWNAPAMRAARAAARQRFARPVDFWQKDWTSFLEGVARGRQ